MKNNKLENLNKAIKTLNEANILYKKDKTNAIVRDAIIVRFTYTYELAWKTIKDFLVENGINVPFNTPKSVFQEAFSAGIIDNEKLWVEMLNARNILAHTYNEEETKEIANEISMKYVNAILKIIKIMENN